MVPSETGQYEQFYSIQTSMDWFNLYAILNLSSVVAPYQYHTVGGIGLYRMVWVGMTNLGERT